MERLNLRRQDAQRALKTLEDILSEPFTTIIRDASIQRFEYTFETVWKFLKEYLKEKEGIVSNSAKSCFREAFALGLLTEQETTLCLEMTDKRNETSHTYKEEVAQSIYDGLKAYAPLMRRLLDKIQSNI